MLRCSGLPTSVASLNFALLGSGFCVDEALRGGVGASQSLIGTQSSRDRQTGYTKTGYMEEAQTRVL